MRQFAFALFIAFFAPAFVLPAVHAPAHAKISLSISIGGVTLKEMRAWKADEPLSRQELAWRVQKLRGFLQFPFLKKKDRRRARALIQAYRQRLAMPPASADERAARALLRQRPVPARMQTRELRALRWQVLDLLASPGLRPQTRQRLVGLRTGIIRELQRRNSAAGSRAERQARNLLARQYDLPAMPLPQLRRLKVRIVDLLASPGLQRQTRISLAGLRQDIGDELRRRSQAQPPADERAARRLLARRHDLPRMSRRRLRNLRGTIGSLLASPDLQRPTRLRLAALRDMVRAELRQRAAAVLSEDERAARHLLARTRSLDLSAMSRRSLRTLRTEVTDLLASVEISRSSRFRLAELRRTIIAELNRRRMNEPRLSANEKQARRLLAQARNLGNLPAAKVESLWMETISLLSRPGVRQQTRRKLASMRRKLAGELNTRRASAAARQILRDTRPPAVLSTQQLRDRLRKIRQALRNPDLPGNLFSRLRRKLAADRSELRRRMAMRENGRWQNAMASTAALLADNRPASRLSTAQLRNRIRSLRKALALRGLTQWRRGVLQRKLDADRAQLRARLIRARNRRRAGLGNIHIRVDTGRVNSPTIIAGESQARDIERQLIAPPSIRLSRRFTLRELRARPDLREYMPAIDLDSIHFGFNEYWVREEEIGKLERIGEAIERIVASNPDEVFLIEGHTDAVGSFDYNQRLSEKRAKAVKEALTQYFNIPADNLVTIGYGERFLKIPTLEAEPENLRVSIRRITPLLQR